MVPPLHAVSSSSIAAVGFDAELSVLYLRFHSGGTYAYFGVPASTHAALLAAGSIGRFFQDRIRDRHPSERVA